MVKTTPAIAAATNPETLAAADYPDETTARIDGWRPITRLLNPGVEDDIIRSIRTALDGSGPWARPVAFRVIGDNRRIAFARLASELVGLAALAAQPAQPAQPAPLAAHAQTSCAA